MHTDFETPQTRRQRQTPAQMPRRSGFISVTTATLLLGLAGCADNSNEPVSTPTPAPTPPTAEQTAAVLSHFRVPDRLEAMAFVPWLYIEADRSMLVGCTGGTATAILNATAAGTGSLVPSGSHNLSIGFTQCRPTHLPFLVHHGEVRQSGTLALPPTQSVAPFDADVQLSWTQFRNTWADEGLDYQINGGSRFQVNSTPAASGSGFTVTTVTTPAAGTAMTNQATTRSVTLSGGTTRFQQQFTVRATGPALASLTAEYTDISYTLAGDTYTLRGSETYVHGATGPATATGELQLLKAGVVVARVAPQVPAGYTVLQASGTIDPF